MLLTFLLCFSMAGQPTPKASANTVIVMGCVVILLGVVAGTVVKVYAQRCCVNYRCCYNPTDQDWRVYSGTQIYWNNNSNKFCSGESFSSAQRAYNFCETNIPPVIPPAVTALTQSKTLQLQPIASFDAATYDDGPDGVLPARVILQRSFDLKTWEPVAGFVFPDPLETAPIEVAEITASASHAFYRFEMAD